jgi:hypothetical protein
MGRKIGGGAGILPLDREGQAGYSEPKDLDCIGQAKTDERFRKGIVAPPNDDQTHQDQCHDRQTNPLECQKGAGTTRDKAKQNPEDTPRGHRGITWVHRLAWQDLEDRATHITVVVVGRHEEAHHLHSRHSDALGGWSA